LNIFSKHSVKNEMQALSVFYPKLTTPLLGVYCLFQTDNESISLGLCLSQQSRLFLEKLLFAYVVKKFLIIFEPTALLTTFPYLSQLHRVYLSSYFFTMHLSC
jgi:hypothetical protein